MQDRRSGLPALLSGLLLAMLAATGPLFAAEIKRYADEDRDWGIAPIVQLRQPPYHAPTPLEIPGAAVIYTQELRAMLAGPDRPVLVDVLAGEGHETLPGSAWLGGAGRGDDFSDALQADLAPLLLQLAGGNKSRPMVFFCASSECWLSYNAALRAVAAGHTRVLWYRGGIDAWVDADLPTSRTVAGQ